MKQNKFDIKILLVLYLLSLLLLLTTLQTINYPDGDEAAFVLQTKLLMEGKTQPNWLLSTGYLTMLAGIPIVKYAFSFVNLRILMMVIAATSTPLMYLILREFNARRNLSILGSFILLTNPYILLHLRLFITEPISLPIYLLSLLFIIKGINLNDNRYLFVGSVFGIAGFLNKQFDAIPGIAAFVFFFFHSRVLNNLKLYKFLNSFITIIENFTGSAFVKVRELNYKSNCKLLVTSLVFLFVILYLSYLYLTTGRFTIPMTAPYSAHHAGLDPQIGINIQSPFRILQDIIFLGFFFLPFSIYLIKYIKTKILIYRFELKVKTFIVLISFFLAILATLVGKPFIVNPNSPVLTLIVTFLFSFSGVSLGIYLFENRFASKVINYCFLALIFSTVFTFFKIGVFLIKYYMVFIPFILIFLTLKIKEEKPYILTILILGAFGILMTINNIQYTETIWKLVDNLLMSGTKPSEIGGQYTVINWLNYAQDNPNAKYVIKSDGTILHAFTDINSIRIETT